MLIGRLYLTYEGLKLFGFGRYTMLIGRLYLTYEGLKQFSGVNSPGFSGSVCILPMRDWNLCGSCFFVWRNWVCILPMRDWNSNNFLWSLIHPCSLYLTYEGLKLIIFANNSRREMSLYLTYEGLKLVFSAFRAIFVFCLYLTYEGSKHLFLQCVQFFLSVCILPMRDRNFYKAWDGYNVPRCLYLTYEGSKLFAPAETVNLKIF